MKGLKVAFVQVDFVFNCWGDMRQHPWYYGTPIVRFWLCHSNKNILLFTVLQFNALTIQRAQHHSVCATCCKVKLLLLGAGNEIEGDVLLCNLLRNVYSNLIIGSHCCWLCGNINRFRGQGLAQIWHFQSLSEAADSDYVFGKIGHLQPSNAFNMGMCVLYSRWHGWRLTRASSLSS